MKKFVLMYCREREVSILGTFDSAKEAQDAMNADFRKYHLEDCQMSEEDLNESLLDACNIDGNCAWSNGDGNNIDWKIEEIEIDEPMESRSRDMLVNWKIAQEAGAWLPCPRCGRLTMNHDIYKNALSRRADIYICDDCGMYEALADAKDSTDKNAGTSNWLINSFE